MLFELIDAVDTGPDSWENKPVDAVQVGWFAYELAGGANLGQRIVGTVQVASAVVDESNHGGVEV